MPQYEVTKLPDGKVNVSFEDGYKLDAADPLAATEELAKSRADRARVAADYKQQLDATKAELDALKIQQQTVQQQTAHQPEVQTPDAQWQTYILEQTAKGLGYNSAAEYKADLARVKANTEEMNNHIVAGTFMAQHPEYPQTDEAADKLTKLLQENNLPFTPQTLAMGNAYLINQGEIKPLSAEEQNTAWAGRMQAENRQTPPPMIPSGSPDSNPSQQNDPWAMKLDDLRKAALQAQR